MEERGFKKSRRLIKSFCGVQGRFFQKEPLTAGGRSKSHLEMQDREHSPKIYTFIRTAPRYRYFHLFGEGKSRVEIKNKISYNVDMSKIKIFESKQVRAQWDENKKKWFFAIIDVVEILTGSERPRKYWNDLKTKLNQEGYIEVSEKIGQLKMMAKDGKMRSTDVADTETLLRIVQSIPSPKAEPFKRWLAKVGYERLEEIEDPELASKRAREIYKAKGYPYEWIEKRMRSIAIREELTDEWSNRGIKEQREYAILTAEISKAAFGLTPSEYKKVKNLKRENLRDHMTDLELIFSMLGEASTTKIARAKDARGFAENEEAAVMGGTIAGNARKALERDSGEKVVTSENYLPKNKKKELKKNSH